ncbi:hypothetical protein BZG20_13590 [Salinivibrio sp. IB868]|uniref:hypothetical protein n=1 Tax=unclassified Salinivibrio TaxID=2636825 RepID=UPI00098799F6|nr:MULTISPECIES: hypothetical protein [unclassified Salinivibrio]OOE65135.1 hypothetical protein BZG20_13590 [Salinivibrio sp. IB868]OOE70780.1 hypothetical protein BZG22_15740 [Salinivibrio sp. IB870]
MISKKDIELLEQQLYQEKTEYYWEFSGIGGKHSAPVRLIVSLFIGLFLPVLLMVAEDTPIWSSGSLFCFTLATMGFLMTRYLFFPDKHRCYHLTSLGIHYTVKDVIPEAAYKVVRGISWVGIAVCIIAGFMLGPLAFVGACGFALMSFGMTNFRPSIDNHYILISERTVVFDLENDGVLSFVVPEKGVYAYYGNIYTKTFEQKQKLLSKLRLLFPNVEFVKIKRLKDKSKHPVYQQEEEKAAE